MLKYKLYAIMASLFIRTNSVILPLELKFDSKEDGRISFEYRYQKLPVPLVTLAKNRI